MMSQIFKISYEVLLQNSHIFLGSLKICYICIYTYIYLRTEIQREAQTEGEQSRYQAQRGTET